MFDRKKHIAFDVETAGELPEYALQPWRYDTGQAWITSYAVAWFDDEGKVKTRSVSMPSRAEIFDFLERTASAGMTICAWNAPFDAGWPVAMNLEASLARCKWLDGMRLRRHWEVEPEYDTSATKKKPYDLKATVAIEYPQFAGYEEGIDFQDMSPEMVAKRLKYNQLDAALTLKLTEKYYNALLESDPKRLRAALIEAMCIPMVAGANVRGLTIDRGAAETLDGQLAAKAQSLLTTLEQHGATPEVLASPKQLAKLLFEDWGLPVQNRSAKTNEPSTDKEALYELGYHDDRAALIKQYREAVNNRTKFVQGTLASLDYNGDGCVRPQAKIFGTYTGRMTFSSKQGRGKAERPTGVAIHQWKRDKDFRNLIAAPEGYTIIEFDFAAQEFRLCAVHAMDDTMLELCQAGEDAHSYMGSRIAGRDYRELVTALHSDDPDSKKTAKTQRQLGKVANLSLQYRTSAAKLRSVARVQYDIPMELPEATLIHSTYQRTYTGMPAYWKRQINKCRRLGYAETLAGRRVQLPGSWTGKDAWSLESTSINFPVQGTGADQKYLALAVMKDRINQFDARFYLELHDGLYWLVPDNHAESFAAMGLEVLSNLPYKRAWGYTSPVQFPVDCKMGKRWGDMVEWQG